MQQHKTIMEGQNLPRKIFRIRWRLKRRLKLISLLAPFIAVILVHPRIVAACGLVLMLILLVTMIVEKIRPIGLKKIFRGTL